MAKFYVIWGRFTPLTLKTTPTNSVKVTQFCRKTTDLATVAGASIHKLVEENLDKQNSSELMRATATVSTSPPKYSIIIIFFFFFSASEEDEEEQVDDVEKEDILLFFFLGFS